MALNKLALNCVLGSEVRVLYNALSKRTHFVYQPDKKAPVDGKFRMSSTCSLSKVLYSYDEEVEKTANGAGVVLQIVRYDTRHRFAPRRIRFKSLQSTSRLTIVNT